MPLFKKNIHSIDGDEFSVSFFSSYFVSFKKLDHLLEECYAIIRNYLFVWKDKLSISIYWRKLIRPGSYEYEKLFFNVFFQIVLGFNKLPFWFFAKYVKFFLNKCSNWLNWCFHYFIEFLRKLSSDSILLFLSHKFPVDLRLSQPCFWCRGWCVWPGIERVFT